MTGSGGGGGGGGSSTTGTGGSGGGPPQNSPACAKAIPVEKALEEGLQCGSVVYGTLSSGELAHRFHFLMPDPTTNEFNVVEFETFNWEGTCTGAPPWVSLLDSEGVTRGVSTGTIGCTNITAKLHGGYHYTYVSRPASTDIDINDDVPYLLQMRCYEPIAPGFRNVDAASLFAYTTESILVNQDSESDESQFVISETHTLRAVVLEQQIDIPHTGDLEISADKCSTNSGAQLTACNTPLNADPGHILYAMADGDSNTLEGYELKPERKDKENKTTQKDYHLVVTVRQKNWCQ
jgi:hypothetical protein